ncbi:MAG: dihydrolipoyl dehydrogenase [Nitrospirae bacterium RBG_13_39_12]|nr:MAG: dihydrolipoyl dehydrogenase [Nitrospirae bacterium RBG_13_39_12]
MKLAVLGAGPGGYVAAIKAAQMGAQVAIIEDSEVGGTCLNWGCIPTKSIAASVEILKKAKLSENFGIEIKGDVIPNLSKIIKRKNKVVEIQVKGIRNLFKSWGITLKEGRGMLISPREIEVTLKDGIKETIKADKIIIATGSRPSQFPAFPFDGNSIISSDDAVNLKYIPKSLLIIGAGIIGCEFANIYKELGSEVTILEMLPRALSTEDVEISEQLEKEFKKKKINLYTNVKIDRLEAGNDGVHAKLPDGKEIVAEKALVSTGRTFNSAGIGLETIGINKDNNGKIIVNENMETNVTGIYAVGDVIGGFMFAHVASREGIISAKNAMGYDEKINYNVVPVSIFTSPEIGSVGLREHQASEKGINIKTGYFQFRVLSKAHIMGEFTGFIKIVSEESSDRILGAHIIGPHATELIHEAALAIKNGLKISDLSETIHAHPTLSEGLMEAAEDVHGEAIHVFKK